MKVLAPIGSALLFLLVAACDREQASIAPPAKAHRLSAAATIAASSARPERQARPDPAERRAEALAGRIYSVPDEELEAMLQSVVDGENPTLRQEGLAILYEETRMRPPSVRLPLLLEIARSGDAHPSVRATIMAELGATLQTDHGSSWADWALALEEHLAETEGLFRVE